MANLQITNIDSTIAMSIAKHMATWQKEITNTFANMCKNLVDSAVNKVEIRQDKIEEKTVDHEDRICALEKMTDELDQSKRGNNVIVRGLLPNPDPKVSVVNMLERGLGIHATVHDIRYAIKLTLKNETQDTISVKVAFYDQRLRDEVYARRMKLKGSSVYISEDLTIKKSALAYEARVYAKTLPNTSTWTSEGKIYMKDEVDEKPRVINSKADLQPADPTNEQKTRKF